MDLACISQHTKRVTGSYVTTHTRADTVIQCGDSPFPFGFLLHFDSGGSHSALGRSIDVTDEL